MEKGPSEYAENWTSPENEVEHFKHAKEFNLKPYEYSESAKRFIENEDDDNLIFKTEDGTVYKYNESTKEFIIISKNGKIVTYYKTSLRYYLKLFKDLNGEWIQGGNYEYIQFR